MVEIPQDIIDNIIAAVGDDTRLLKQCTLVSSSFLLPCRKQLFSRIYLTNNQTCHGIHQFLVQNPVIQSFVRSISLEHMSSPETAKWMNSLSLLALLRLPLCRLECFSITLCPDYLRNWNWNCFSSDMKDALLNIIHSSTLKTLSLTGITELPITFFFHIVHLTTLELHSLLLSDIVGENSSWLTQAASKGMAPMASHTVVDRCVWRFGTEHEGSHRSTESIFLPFLCRPRFFEIYVDIYFPFVYDLDILTYLMGSLCISLTPPATLEYLEFTLNVRFDDFTNDDNDIFYGNLRDADVWSHLDSITTHPTGSRLQRVDVNINYSFRCNGDAEPDEDEVVNAILDSLPLLRGKGILFVKAALGEWL